MSALARTVLIGCAVIALASCSVQPRVLTRETGMLEVQIEWVGDKPEEPHPRLFVDDRPLGHIDGSRTVLYLTEGEHVVEIASPGFVTWSGRIYVTGRPNRQLLRVKLHKRADVPAADLTEEMEGGPEMAEPGGEATGGD